MIIKAILALLSALIIFLFIKFFIKPYRRYRYYRNQGYQGNFYPVIGFGKKALHNFKTKGDILASYKELGREDPKAKLIVSNFGDRCVLQLLDAKLIKEFYNSSEHYEKSKLSPGMRLMTGRGLVALEGDEWKKRRKIISTMFHFNFINENLPVVVGTTREFLNELKKGPLKDVAIMDEVQKITGEIVGRIFFGNNLNQYKIDGQILTLHLAELIGGTAKRGATAPVIALNFLSLSPTLLPSYNHFLDKIRRFRDVCYSIVTDRKKSPTKTTDLLNLLLDYQEKNKNQEDAISDWDIVDEFVAFFSAGMDTTGHMVAMAIYLLAKNPQYLPRLRQEIERTNLNESNVTNELVNKLEFHNCVLKEALRIYTPGPGTFPRVAKHDFMLGDLKVFKGVSLRPNFFYNFFHPDYFEEPEAFKPERWETMKSMDPFVFIPFSAGARNCIGQHLAMIEGKIILSEFLKMFDFKIPEEYVVKMTARFLYEPSEKIPVDLNVRA